MLGQAAAAIETVRRAGSLYPAQTDRRAGASDPAAAASIPVSLVGSSLGAFVALHAAAQDAAGAATVDRLILLAPALDLRNGPTGADIDQWRRDGRLRVHHYAWNEPRDVGFALYEDAARYDAFALDLPLPMLVFQGRRDASVDPAMVERWAAGRSNVDLRMVDDDHQLAASMGCPAGSDCPAGSKDPALRTPTERPSETRRNGAPKPRRNGAPKRDGTEESHGGPGLQTRPRSTISSMAPLTRREFQINLTRFGVLAAAAPWAIEWTSESVRAGDFAQALTRTPPQTEGPFYPKPLPLDVDNDLLIINDAITPAVGTITHLGGRILDASGTPVRNALVEIWQVDDHGVYLHTGSASGDRRDRNFQGFGRFLTGARGEYYFRTVKPVPYPGRTPHIHFKIKRAGRELLTTQCYIKGHPQNAQDGVLRGISDARARESVMVDFVPMPESKIGELGAVFDVVLGVTPEMP
jgi:protocatechuate 3,4-dioxygenase beta subunit